VLYSGSTYSFGMFVVKLEKEFPDMTMAEQSKQPLAIYTGYP